MIHKISEKIICWQVIKGNITEEERNKYVYSYEILLNQLINISIAMVLAVISCELKSVMLFLVIYIPLRKYAGGFHAKTNERCIVYSSLIIIYVIFLNKWLRSFEDDYQNIMAICSMLLLAFVCYVAPVEAKNKKLDMEENRKYRRKVHIICIIHIFIMALNVLVLKRICISINILLGYLTLFWALIIAYKNKARKLYIEERGE